MCHVDLFCKLYDDHMRVKVLNIFLSYFVSDLKIIFS